jgi:hypothetical protein
MLRFALVLTSLTIMLGARAADARQTKAPALPTAQLELPSPAPRASEREVRRLVGLVGVVEKELASIDVVMNVLKQRTPNVPEKVWTEVRAEFVKTFNREAIIAGYVPIYAGHFNAKEVRQLIAFYSSPVGKKLVAEMPVIETEAFFKGMERGQEIGERVREILKAKGYTVPST